jgi:hypothetical protein
VYVTVLKHGDETAFDEVMTTAFYDTTVDEVITGKHFMTLNLSLWR